MMSAAIVDHCCYVEIEYLLWLSSLLLMMVLMLFVVLFYFLYYHHHPCYDYYYYLNDVVGVGVVSNLI